MNHVRQDEAWHFVPSYVLPNSRHHSRYMFSYVCRAPRIGPPLTNTKVSIYYHMSVSCCAVRRVPLRARAARRHRCDDRVAVWRGHFALRCRIRPRSGACRLCGRNVFYGRLPRYTEVSFIAGFRDTRQCITRPVSEIYGFVTKHKRLLLHIYKNRDMTLVARSPKSKMELIARIPVV